MFALFGSPVGFAVGAIVGWMAGGQQTGRGGIAGLAAGFCLPLVVILGWLLFGGAMSTSRQSRIKSNSFPCD